MIKKFTLAAVLALVGTSAFAQNDSVESPYEYKFTIVKEHPATPVKDQAKTGTCWCFATTSFIESELIKCITEVLVFCSVGRINTCVHHRVNGLEAG